ncbi:hypothetical protein PS861_01074 [Pseudomonas fluorescens]|nr:hypothetical protein PS861_01074 [Pseudomonas fluorescens]
MGGDEFSVLAPEAPLDVMIEIAERILLALDLLREMVAGQAKGYHFAKPMGLEALLASSLLDRQGFTTVRYLESPMSPIITRLLALLILCLTLEVPAQTNGCPAGEKQVCLDDCICLPDVVPDDIYQIAAPGLALWLTQARAEAANAGIQPIPPHIREQLLHWYAPSVLDTARYKISDNGQFNAATAMLQNPDVGAVTLIDIILFRDAQSAEQDIALWAHELKHVQQYQEWGVLGFAQRYTQDFNAVEAPAYAIQAEVRRSLRAGTY